jgi:hypothetical protein
MLGLRVEQLWMVIGERWEEQVWESFLLDVGIRSHKHQVRNFWGKRELWEIKQTGGGELIVNFSSSRIKDRLKMGN